MVTDDLSPRGTARAGVGPACRGALEDLCAGGGVAARAWIERNGLVRCAAAAGDVQQDGAGGRQAHDLVMRAFETGIELYASDIAAAQRADADAPLTAARAVAQMCVPVRAAGRIAGVLDAKLEAPVDGGDIARVRAAADDLARRIESADGIAAEAPAERLLRHLGRLAGSQDVETIARTVLDAALDISRLHSGVVTCRNPDGALGPYAVTGPLGEQLAARAAAMANVSTGGGDAGPGSVRRLHAAPPDPGGPSHAQPVIVLDLIVQGRSQGALLLGGDAGSPVPEGVDAEMLEVLGLHAASALRTADVVRGLRERAATDPLTGLGHHATFHESLAAAHRRPTTAVVLCDLDGFKRLNDTFGHQHGDRVLRAVAQALHGALRRGDRLFRIGGDEFAALISVADGAEALDVVLRLRAAVIEADLGLTLSIGVAVPHDGEPDAALLARADRALYEVKASGRDGVALANDDPLPIRPPR